nr:MAG TPA: hypothetical protein [Caudoviricetes sp.]
MRHRRVISGRSSTKVYIFTTIYIEEKGNEHTHI